jgi:hypothetical protein
MTEPDVNRAIEFLSMLFIYAEVGYVSLFSIEAQSRKRRTAWAPATDIPSLAQSIWDLGLSGDVWFGCATRREILPEGRRGGIEDCLAIPGLWLDVDVAGPGHRLSGLATSYDQARLFIEGYSERPTAIVRSGHGFQSWWRFREMVDAEDALPLLAHWRLAWLNRGIAAGIHIDDVWDMPRILRLPGTHNFKGTQ